MPLDTVLAIAQTPDGFVWVGTEAGLARFENVIIPSTRPNEAWAMDFVADQLARGNKLRVLTVVDTYTRECLATDIGARLPSENVVATLTRLCRERGAPKRIHCDNGSEFAGQMTNVEDDTTCNRCINQISNLVSD